MAFGDGELVASTTYSFAVRNEVQELKEAVNFITRSYQEDAVMKTILQMLSLQ
jgi:hydroxymethylpyrimidine pyrophosphatase-like HAD family hydrolase